MILIYSPPHDAYNIVSMRNLLDAFVSSSSILLTCVDDACECDWNVHLEITHFPFPMSLSSYMCRCVTYLMHLFLVPAFYLHVSMMHVNVNGTFTSNLYISLYRRVSQLVFPPSPAMSVEILTLVQYTKS